MSHFYMTIRGSRAEKTCTGHKTNGGYAKVNSWNDGAQIDAQFNEETQKNEYRIYSTGG